MSHAPEVGAPSAGKLRRELGFLETIVLSIGISAPTAVLALNGVLPAGIVGKATPLAFAFAAIIVALVAYVYVHFTRTFASAGSVYAFAGRGWGPRAGFIGGWVAFGAYLALTVGVLAQFGLFFGQFLDSIGVGAVDWLPLALLCGVVLWVVLYRDIRLAARTLLTVEGISVLGILALFAVIYYRIFSDSAPSGQGFTLSPFDPSGLSFSTIASASVIGFLSFIGFDGAATLGEESRDPRRTIPRAIVVYVVVMGVFFTFGMFTETLGFGVGKEGVLAFASSAAPLTDLSNAYVGEWLGELILLGASFSAFACTIGLGAATARILMALARDGFLSRRLGEVHPTTGSPAAAGGAVVLTSGVVLAGMRLAQVGAVEAFFYPATVGTFLILTAYVIANLAGINFFFLGRRLALWKVLVPTVGVAALVYTFYKNVYPVQPSPYNLFPYIAAAWLLVGVAIVLAFPRLARQMGERLATELSESDGERGSST